MSKTGGYMHCGQIFNDRYRIIRVLGRGGMGKVYLAENIKLGTLWAIKEINKHGNFRGNVLVEPNILKKLDHPALPRIFDIIEDEHFIYVIVDYIEGVSLDKKLLEEGGFCEETVIGWAKQICSVLYYLHTFKPNPIIYRDIKPSNIILAKNGRIKLIDFGIAREYKTGLDNDTVYIGTRGYAAPEQYGMGQTGVTSDIYSLGVTLHQLLTGKSPTEPPCELKPVRHYNPNLSEEIERIICKCTRYNPKERYQSANELLADLQSISGNEILAGCQGIPGQDISSQDICYQGIFSQDTPGQDIPGNELSAGFRDISRENTIRKPGAPRHVQGRKTPWMKDARDCSSRFKKLVLTIWDNAEFGCELAYAAAKLSKYNVALIDLDLLNPRADLILNVSKTPGRILKEGTFGSSGINVVMDSIARNYFYPELLVEASVKRRELGNLFILTGNYRLGDYEYYSNDSLVKLIEKAYQQFDIAILLVNRSIYDSYTVISLMKSDYNIIPIRADVDNLREFNRYLSFLKETHQIPMDKTKFVAFSYNPLVNLNEAVIDEITENNYIGHISYSFRRERYRNLKIPFARRMERQVLDEYASILLKFNVLPGRTLLMLIKSQVESIIRAIALLRRKLVKLFRHKHFLSFISTNKG